MQDDVTAAPSAFLSTEPANSRVKRIAWIVVSVSAMIFLCAVPFAKNPWFQIPAFVPIYVSFLVIGDIITAVLLLSHFNVLRSWGLLVLAGGYLFTAFATIGYSLIFPGFFVQNGLFGSGPQTSSAMYMFWHGGFPVVVLIYSAVRGKRVADRGRAGRRFEGRTSTAVFITIAIVIGIVGAFLAFATAGNKYLPEFLAGNRTTDLGHVFLTAIWFLNVCALVSLFVRKPHTILDTWLMVVMCVWIFDIAQSALLNTGRYDVGWYFGRIYGIVGSSLLLVILLVENSAHYARLFQLTLELSAANKTLERLSSQDGLTLLANRRSFDRYLSEQVSIANRHGRALALVISDVDHFKMYNDTYGHQAGDDCLKQISAALRSCCRRPGDMAARYGGEEFALILPDTDETAGARIADWSREAVAALNIPHTQSPAAPHVSISAGIAILRGKIETSAQELIAAADKALYRAKQMGRNRTAL